MWSYIARGVFLALAIYFLVQGIRCGAALMTPVRTLVFQCTSIMLLPMIWGIDGVWISVVVAEFISVVLGSLFLIGKRKKYHY